MLQNVFAVQQSDPAHESLRLLAVGFGVLLRSSGAMLSAEVFARMGRSYNRSFNRDDRVYPSASGSMAT
jgi:hypothetical protein